MPPTTIIHSLHQIDNMAVGYAHTASHRQAVGPLPQYGIIIKHHQPVAPGRPKDTYSCDTTALSSTELDTTTSNRSFNTYPSTSSTPNQPMLTLNLPAREIQALCTQNYTKL